jgi:quercetin dioxygenase-like cupin family protein
MKRRILLCLLTTLLTAQTAQEVEITNEPHHHLTFENKSVRVFNVEVPPNDVTGMHWHRHDYIAVALGASEIANTVKDKPAATVKFTDGDTRFAAATFVHAVRDTGTGPFRNVTVEILEDAALRTATSPWDPAKNEDRGLETFPGGTQQILFVKDAIRASELELQPGAAVPAYDHKGPHLLIAVSDLNLHTAIKGQAPGPFRLKSGEVRWLPAGSAHTLANTGDKPAKFVTLEFP